MKSAVVQAAAEPPAGQFRGARKRCAVHARDHFEGAVLLVAGGVWRELTKPAALVVVVHPPLHDLACVVELDSAVIATGPHVGQLVAQFGVPDQRRQILDRDRHPDVVDRAVASSSESPDRALNCRGTARDRRSGSRRAPLASDTVLGFTPQLRQTLGMRGIWKWVGLAGVAGVVAGGRWSRATNVVAMPTRRRTSARGYTSASPRPEHRTGLGRDGVEPVGAAEPLELGVAAVVELEAVEVGERRRAPPRSPGSRRRRPAPATRAAIATLRPNRSSPRRTDLPTWMPMRTRMPLGSPAEVSVGYRGCTAPPARAGRRRP